MPCPWALQGTLNPTCLCVPCARRLGGGKGPYSLLSNIVNDGLWRGEHRHTLQSINARARTRRRDLEDSIGRGSSFLPLSLPFRPPVSCSGLVQTFVCHAISSMDRLTRIKDVEIGHRKEGGGKEKGRGAFLSCYRTIVPRVTSLSSCEGLRCPGSLQGVAVLVALVRDIRASEKVLLVRVPRYEAMTRVAIAIREIGRAHV